MKKKMGNRLFLIFMLGMFIRLLLAPYTTHCATWEKIGPIGIMYYTGINIVLMDTAQGPSFQFFYLPMYIPYLALNYFGIHETFLLVFLFKIPAILGDIIVFYSLYNLTLLISRDERKGLYVAALYFLNPYTITVSTIWGHFEQLMASFILLALLYLLKRKISLSAICLSIATLFRYIPLLLLPAFLTYLWHKDKALTPRISRFLALFAASLLIISLPYLTSLTKLYLFSQPMLWHYLTKQFLGAGSPFTFGVHVSPTTFFLNFTALLTVLGIWPSVEAFFNSSTFFLLYFIATVFMLKRSRPSADLINRYILVVLILFMLSIPLIQGHHLMWIFPFVLLEVQFFGLPSYYPHVIWLVQIIMDQVLGGNFRYTSVLPSLNSILRSLDWPFGNYPMSLSLGALNALTLLLTMISCLSFTRKIFGSRFERQMSSSNSKTTSSIRDQHYILCFLMYCLLEILRVAYGIRTNYLTLPLAIFGGSILTTLGFYIYRKRSATFGRDPLFSSNLTRIVALFYAIITAITFLIIAFFQLDNSIFLVVQLSLFGTLWLFNRRSNLGLNLQRSFLIFTVMYIICVLAITENNIIAFITPFYLALWLCIQIILEVTYRDEN